MAATAWVKQLGSERLPAVQAEDDPPRTWPSRADTMWLSAAAAGAGVPTWKDDALDARMSARGRCCRIPAAVKSMVSLMDVWPLTLTVARTWCLHQLLPGKVFKAVFSGGGSSQPVFVSVKDHGDRFQISPGGGPTMQRRPGRCSGLRPVAYWCKLIGEPAGWYCPGAMGTGPGPGT